MASSNGWKIKLGWARALALLFALLLAVVLPARTRADTAIQVTTPPAVQDHFPNELTFTVSAQDSVQITNAVLHYQFQPDGNSVVAGAEFDKGTSIQATYHMRSNGNPLYLPPGRTIAYNWEITDANGSTLTTDTAQTIFNDTRFQWQSVTDGNLTLYYYKGTDSAAKNLLTVGRSAIDKAQQLEAAQIDYPLKLFAYASSTDFLPAAQKESQTTDPGILGQAQAPDVVLFISSSLQGPEAEDTVRHELTHLVTAASVQGGFSSLLPLWLNEGISVNAQADPGDYGRAVQIAVANDSVVPIEVLESSRGIDAGLFYGESYALVKFMIGTGGQPKFAQLLAAIKGGQSFNQALQTLYGFDQDGLYNAWRESVNLARAAAPALSTASPQAAQQSTNPSAQSGQGPSRGSGQSSSTDNGTLVLFTVLGLTLMLLLLAGIVGLGVVLARRSRP